MKFSDRMGICLKSAYNATFHKRHILGKMGYLHDDLVDALANDINYLKFNPDDIRMCKSEDVKCRQGIKLFADQDYKAAYKMFDEVDVERFPEVNFCKAICMLYGKGTKRNVNEAFEMVKKNMEISSCCMQLTARCYIEGYGVKKNKKKAYELILKLISEHTNDLEEDYLLPDLIFFCAEYELEMGEDILAIEHLRIAAVEMGYGPAYYLLGKYYFEEDPEKGKMYMDKARALNVSVAAKYYSEERKEIADEPIDGGVMEKMSDMTDQVSHITDSLGNIYDNVKRLDKRQRKIDRKKLDMELNDIEHETEMSKVKYKEEKRMNEAESAMQEARNLKKIRNAKRKVWLEEKAENIEKKIRKE